MDDDYELSRFLYMECGAPPLPDELPGPPMPDELPRFAWNSDSDGGQLEKSVPLPSDLFNDPDEVLSVGSGDKTPPPPDPSQLLADMCCRYCCLKNENVKDLMLV